MSPSPGLLSGCRFVVRSSRGAAGPGRAVGSCPGCAAGELSGREVTNSLVKRSGAGHQRGKLGFAACLCSWASCSHLKFLTRLFKGGRGYTSLP